MASNKKTQHVPGLAPGIDRKNRGKDQAMTPITIVGYSLSALSSTSLSLNSLSLGKTTYPSTFPDAPSLHPPTMFLLWSSLKMEIFLLSYTFLKLTAFISHTKSLLLTWKLLSPSLMIPLTLRKGTASFKSIMMSLTPPLFPMFSNPMQKAVTCSCLYIP